MILKKLRTCVALLTAAALASLFIQNIWNDLVPNLLRGPTLTYPQAASLTLLGGFLSAVALLTIFLFAIAPVFASEWIREKLETDEQSILRLFGDDLVIDPMRIVVVSRKGSYEYPDRRAGSSASTGATIILDNGASVDASPKAADELFAYLSASPSK